MNQESSFRKGKAHIEQMFSSIAPRYDLLNTILSFGLHRRWKKKAVRKANLKKGDSALDLCSGTGDLAIYLAREVGERGKVIALDFSREMLKLGQRKIAGKKLERVIKFQHGDATQLNFADNSFEAVTVGFGIRNIENIEQVFQEMHRVLKPGGRAVCLEFSQPISTLVRIPYDFYSFKVIPRLGGLISGNSQAYFYLSASIREFPDQEELKTLMEEVGFKKVSFSNLAWGIVALHVGEK